MKKSIRVFGNTKVSYMKDKGIKISKDTIYEKLVKRNENKL